MSENPTPATKDTEVSNSTPASSSCNCLTQLFGALKKLMMDISSESNLPKAIDEPATGCRTPLNGRTKAQIVVLDNQQVISSISGILQCSCEKDGYMLTILATIVTKLLSRYAEAVPRLLGSAEKRNAQWGFLAAKLVQTQHIEDDCVFFEDAERMAAQEILNELHRVQRLVNELSPRLRTQEDAVHPDDSPERQLLLSLSSQNKALQRPFSAITVEGIGRDMRASLSSLSRGIISILQET
ncbi:uncharacterized protein JN550_002332 [Neoarthrinium moseri]|uniref:uncharacterized protein n=1 Tax=Neoarthrinium moseri TaxID=1658444 RepID=UPI001FDB8102|nr:uncharacterized protein JN550_002332 [Neoarthrinium moseri]KAI1874903.1 hypothetical protein JN550_002332 [Neoarthrinium moseri]